MHSPYHALVLPCNYCTHNLLTNKLQCTPYHALLVLQLGDGQGDWAGAVPEHSDLWPRHLLHCPSLLYTMYSLILGTPTGRRTRWLDGSWTWTFWPLASPSSSLSFSFVHNVLSDPRYTNWETDKVIGRELYQNILTSGLAIFFTVLLFLGRLEEIMYMTHDKLWWMH
jgi:hypothetical protein